MHDKWRGWSRGLLHQSCVAADVHLFCGFGRLGSQLMSNRRQFDEASRRFLSCVRCLQFVQFMDGFSMSIEVSGSEKSRHHSSHSWCELQLLYLPLAVECVDIALRSETFFVLCLANGTVYWILARLSINKHWLGSCWPSLEKLETFPWRRSIKATSSFRLDCSSHQVCEYGTSR